MIALGLALLCFQTCLVQTVFSQTRCVRSPFDYAPGLWASSCGEFGPYGFAGPYRGILAGPFSGLFAGPGELATGPVGAYGGEGVGEVSVAGELPAGGATDVAGEVPILGAVEFAGPVRAAGAVTISGTCGCGRSFFY